MRKNTTWRNNAWREKVRQGAYKHWGDTVARFWSKVDIRGENECWPWQAYRDKRNYGYVRLRVQSRLQASHRVAYFFTYGELPNLHICHKCDNPICCNPKHLFAGTNSDNIKDAVKKGRMCCGENRPQSKLKNGQVLEIRRMYSRGGISQHELSKLFGVHRSAIEKIILRHAWKHI